MIKMFQSKAKEHERQTGSDEPDQLLLHECFPTRADMECVWKRLEKARGRKPQSIRDAWDNLKKLGPAAAKSARQHTLWYYMKNDCDELNTEWTDAILKYEDKISKTHEKSNIGARMYPEELRRIHGAIEMRRLIKTGMLREVKDEADNQCYVKVVHQEKISKTREQSLASSGHRFS